MSAPVLLRYLLCADFGFEPTSFNDVESQKYRAPEAACQSSLKRVENKEDVFSAGLLILEVLSRTRSYVNCSWDDVKWTSEKTNQRLLPEATPQQVRKLLHATWETSPTKRPGFSEIILALNSIGDEAAEEMLGLCLPV